MGKLDRKDDGFLQGGLGTLEAGDVVPFHVGFLGEDRTRQARTEFLEFGVLIVVTSGTFATECACGPIGGDHLARFLLFLRLDVLLERFGAGQVFVYLGSDQHF